MREGDLTDARAVLMVIDVQNGFVNDRSAVAVPVIAGVLREWRAEGGDVVFTRFHNYPDSPYERLIGWRRLTASPETDLVPEVTPYVEDNTPVLDKTVYTLFTPEGEQLVERSGWTDLYLCGIDTDNCVLKTAVDAFERGLTPWIIADACASTGGQPAHDAGLLIARRFIGGGQIITSEAIPFRIAPAAP